MLNTDSLAISFSLSSSIQNTEPDLQMEERIREDNLFDAGPSSRLETAFFTDSRPQSTTPPPHSRDLLSDEIAPFSDGDIHDLLSPSADDSRSLYLDTLTDAADLKTFTTIEPTSLSATASTGVISMPSSHAPSPNPTNRSETGTISDPFEEISRAASPFAHAETASLPAAIFNGGNISYIDPVWTDLGETSSSDE